MTPKSILILIYCSLLIGNLYATAIWQVAVRVLKRNPGGVILLAPILSATVVELLQVTTSYLPKMNSFYVVYETDSVCVLLKQLTLLSALPLIYWFISQRLASAKIPSEEQGDFFLTGVFTIGSLMLLKSIGIAVSGKVNPPLETLPLLRIVFYLYQSILMYVVYVCFAFLLLRYKSNRINITRIALNSVLLAYIIYIVGMIALKILFVNFYSGKAEMFLTHVRFDTFLCLMFVSAFVYSVKSSHENVNFTVFIKRMFILNWVLAFGIPYLTGLVDGFMKYTKQNLTIIFSTLLTCLVTIIVTKLIERALARSGRNSTRIVSQQAITGEPNNGIHSDRDKLRPGR